MSKVTPSGRKWGDRTMDRNEQVALNDALRSALDRVAKRHGREHRPLIYESMQEAAAVILAELRKINILR